MELWCLDCIRDGKWRRAETLAAGSALCADHAMTDDRRQADNVEAKRGELRSTAKPNR